MGLLRRTFGTAMATRSHRGIFDALEWYEGAREVNTRGTLSQVRPPALGAVRQFGPARGREGTSGRVSAPLPSVWRICGASFKPGAVEEMGAVSGMAATRLATERAAPVGCDSGLARDQRDRIPTRASLNSAVRSANRSDGPGLTSLARPARGAGSSATAGIVERFWWPSFVELLTKPSAYGFQTRHWWQRSRLVPRSRCRDHGKEY